MNKLIGLLAHKWGKAAGPKKAVVTATRRVSGRDGVYSWEEISRHNTPEDAWTVIADSVYDISGYGDRHPGGDVLYSYAGRDATDVFAAFHKKAGPGPVVLKSLLIGSVEDPQQPTGIVRDYRALRQEFEDEGYFSASPVYYTRKVMELLLMVSASLVLLYTGLAAAYLPLRILSGLFLAFFWHQCGWTCHDFLHNQAFKSRKMNAIVGGAILNAGMGGSSHWWKNKHNQHHATPNKLDENNQAVDPDIDTMPLIAWSKELLKAVDPKQRGIVQWQHILTWPMLTLAYMVWQQQGVAHLSSFPSVSKKQRGIELAAIIFHHTWSLYSIFSNLSFGDACMFWFLTHALSGFMTSFVFVQSHNGMEVYADEKDFVSAQIVSTRNVAPGLVMDWFCGGLNYQIEHHLFPTMPRHSFFSVKERVAELCTKHGLEYEVCSMAESTRRVFSTLAELAAEHDHTD